MKSRKAYSLIIIFFALILFFQSGKQTSAIPVNVSVPPDVSGSILFSEGWHAYPSTVFPNERWEVTDGSWELGQHTVIQSDDTANQLNILYEKPIDVADGTIYGSMQLDTLPSGGEALFPHGFVFRFDAEQVLGYGVGFIDEDTLALGRKRMINGDPVVELLYQTDGSNGVTYDAHALNYFKIVLERGDDPGEGRIKVFVSTTGDFNDPTDPTDINFTSPLLDGDVFRSGKVGIGTFGATAEFGPLTVAFDCADYADVNDLSPIGQAVYNSLGSESRSTFCGNKIEELILLPGDTPPVHRDAFLKYADLIGNAQYEVFFTTMLWDPMVSPVPNNPSPPPASGALALLGYDPQTESPPYPLTGLPKLYQNVVEHPENYPDGVIVRILIGYSKDARVNVLETLKEGGIPLCYPTPECGDWRVEVASFNYHFLDWSHIKSLVVDEEQTIVSGYNVNNWYVNGTHDAGIHVSGPVGSTSMNIFAENWKKNSSDSGLCEPGIDDLLTITDIVNQCHEYMPSLDSFAENEFAPPIKSVELLDENHFVFPLYRNDNLKESDDAIVAGIEAAVSNVNIWQKMFSYDGDFVLALPYAMAIRNTIQKNDDNNNSTFNVNLLLLNSGGNSSGSVGSEYSRYPNIVHLLNRRGVLRMRNILGDLHEYFQVKLFAEDVHTKALSIDDDFLIVGSQNWDSSAWGNGMLDLHEYNLGVDNAQITAEFNNEFSAIWNDPTLAFTPCELYPDENWWPLFLDCGDALENNLADSSDNMSLSPTIWLDEGIYMGSNLNIDHPVTVVGLGADTVLEPDPDILVKTGEPIMRITSSNVTLTGLHFRNSSGYAIEIGDGITPIENVFIGQSIFENSGLGGIKINGSADIHYIQNNTFVGGEAGIVINVSGTSDGNTIVQDNIFSGQTVMPIVVESANDGGVTYSYNLFNNCNRVVTHVCPNEWISGDMYSNSIYDHNLINTPIHFDTDSGNYSLLYPSSAIDAAKPIDSTDGYAGFYFDGDGDNSIRPDIGAVEFIPGELSFTAPILYSPQPGETMPEFPIEMTFGSRKGIEEATFQIQVATDGQFLNVVADERITGEYQYIWAGIPDKVKADTDEPGIYYWRVQITGWTSAIEQWWSPIRQFMVTDPAPPTPTPPPPTPTPVSPTSTPTPVPPSCIFTPPATGNPPGVDLLVTNVTLSPANPVTGQQVVVNVTIKNQGQADMIYDNGFYLDFYVNPSPEPPEEDQNGTLWWGIQSTDFPAGASHTYSDNYVFSTSGDMRIWAQADTDSKVVESNESNNTYGCLGISVSSNGAFTEELVETPTPAVNMPRVTPTPSQP